MTDESCYGCGEEPKDGVHPWVGVMNKADVAPGREPLHFAEGGVFVAVPVCEVCHVDPAHRTVAIKAHFHRRDRMKRATEMAGSDSVGA